MIALTDQQLATVMEAAALLPVEKREVFLWRVSASLHRHGTFGYREVSEACTQALQGLVHGEVAT